MPKINMRKTMYGEERVIPVEEHSVAAREAQGWARVWSPAEVAKYRRDLTAEDADDKDSKIDKAVKPAAKEK